MRLTIGKKLNSLIVTLQLLSIGGVIVMATQLFTSDLTGLLRKGTLDVSGMIASRVRAEMKHASDRARILAAASYEDYRHNEDKIRFLETNLSSDPQYVGLGLYRRNEAGQFTPSWRIANTALIAKLSLTKEDFTALDTQYPVSSALISKGTVDFVIAKFKDGNQALRMGLPLVQLPDGSFSQYLVLELNEQKLSSLFSEATTYTSFLVDRRGRVLGSTDLARYPLGQDASRLPIFQTIAANKGQAGQQDYTDTSGTEQIAAYQRVGFADLAVVTQIPMERALTAQRHLLRRTTFLGGAFLFLAFALSFLFSESLTRPIRALAQAAARVAQGDFQVRLNSGKPTGDEIQQFSSTFNGMVEGLQERDRVKATFAKFHSKEVAEKVMSGELKLGGERKSAAVFFSDVRGFTAMSENMDPEALVRILNRYMSKMVHIVLEHGGIVDKFVGDAIMAIWGVPLSKDDDCERALRACIAMRSALAILNEELKAENLPALKIGMGMNFGPLIAGNIGSDERMEYTVIGDTVNTASRIESLTKEFGTDLLISQEFLNRVQGKFIVEKAHEAKVKGKSEPLIIYKVHGYLDALGKEIRVETAYSSYASEKSDKVVHEKSSDKPAGDPTPDVTPYMERVAELEMLLRAYQDKEAREAILPPAFAPPPFKKAA